MTMKNTKYETSGERNCRNSNPDTYETKVDFVATESELRIPELQKKDFSDTDVPADNGASNMKTLKRKAEENEVELCSEMAPKLCKKEMTPDSFDTTEVFYPSTPVNMNNDSFSDSFVLGRRRTSKSDCPKKDYFASLPDEVLLFIFKMFQHKPTLVNCACVCRRWRNIAFDNDLWTRIELSHHKIETDIMGLILSRRPTILRMSQTEVVAPMFKEVRDKMENFVSKIEYLDLTMTSIELEDLRLLLRTCATLIKLSLEYVRVDENVCVEIAKNSNLRVLNMSMCIGVCESGLKAILINCKKLTELNLAWTHLDAAEIKCVCQYVPKDIIRLNLSGSKQLTDNYVSALVIRCNKLKELDLSDATAITTNSIHAICDNLNNLQILSLSRCYNIHPAGYIKLFRLPSITHLNIFGLFLESQIETLRKTSDVKVNTMKFSFVARPTVGNRRTSIWELQVRD